MKSLPFGARTIEKSCSLNRNATIPKTTTTAAILIKQLRSSSKWSQKVRLLLPFFFSILFFHFIFLFFRVGFSSIHPFTEAAYALTDTLHHLRYFLSTEKEQYDKYYKDYLRQSETTYQQQ